MKWGWLAGAASYLPKGQRLNHRSSSSTIQRRLVAVAVITAPLGMITLIMVLALTAVVVGTPAAAAHGALGIPPVVFTAYLSAEANASHVADDCVVEWPVIAGIWKVESGHATHGGRTITPAGDVTPHLYGPTLDGALPGTAQIPDSDGGLLDGDPTWDRAVGPAQFLPGSWRSFGQDANHDGTADPQNVFDAALATVAHLCLASPGDYTNPADLEVAVRRYNNSAEYVATVTRWIDYYRAFRFAQGEITADGLYAFPLPHDTVTVDQIHRSHHDYPASDLAVPEGTPVYAAHPGIVTKLYTPCPTCKCGLGVTITGHDNHRYTYCHASQTFAQVGAEVTAGELIMTSGNTGNSQAPHLHLQIHSPDGALICPQPLLDAWWSGIGLSPIAAPTSGCAH